MVYFLSISRLLSTVDMYEFLKKVTKVASVDMGKQAGGIIFWKME